MGWFARLIGTEAKTPRKRSGDGTASDSFFWGDALFTSPTVSGIRINQATALNASAVMSCVTMLAEDVAKLTPRIWRRHANRTRTIAKDHPLYRLLYKPNDWQSWMEFCEQMQVGLILRGNAYAVKIRDGRGNVVKLIPVNPDWVSLWEAPAGELFYRVTAQGLHLLAELKGQPFMIPQGDVLHIRGFSLNGLLGASRILLAKEAIGLFLAQEQQAARLMGNGARPSGVLATDQKLTPEAAKRIAQDWRDMHGALANSGKTAVLEQGLKWEAISLSSVDMEFIASRQFQLQEIARIFRVPPHMIGELSRSTNNNIAQQSQEYANYTLSGYTQRWVTKIDTDFELRDQDLEVEFDYSVLTRPDLAARYNAYRIGIMSMVLTPNEARIDDGRDPIEGADELIQPANMSAMGSQSSGSSEGGGAPKDGELKRMGHNGGPPLEGWRQRADGLWMPG